MSRGHVDQQGLRGRLREAVLWRTVFLVVQGGASLLLLVLFAQLLPPQPFAVTAVALAVVVVTQALGDLGLSQAVATGLPMVRDGDAADEIRGAVAGFGAAALLATGLVVAAAFVVPSEARTAVLASAPAAAMMVLVSGTDAILRGGGEVRRSTVLVLLSRLGGFAAVPVAAATNDAEFACTAFSAGTVVGTAPAVVALLRSAPPGPRTWQLVGAAVPLGLAQFFVVAGGRLNTLVVGTAASLYAAAAFEAGWRVYQLGLYSVGVLGSASAPLVGSVSAAGRRDELRSLLGWLIPVAAGSGVIGGIVLWLGGTTIGDLLFPTVADEVAGVLERFAFVCPITFVGALGSTVLAVSRAGRRLMLLAHAVGASVGVGLVLALAADHGAEGAALGCAIGLAVTYLPLCVALLELRRRLSG